jgi:dihydrodipicolinate synthase/N-acetylneuraminate lyase
MKTLRGVYPILATCFLDNDEIDYGSQKKLIEFCIEGGVHGLVLLANASEGHLMSEREKTALIDFCLKEIAGRVPVIVTVNHPSAKVATEMAVYAEQQGASAVMALPPFFGRWRAGLDEIFAYFETMNRSLRIPIVIQDHVLTDISMPVAFMLDMARKLENVKYIKLESGNLIHKARRIGELNKGELVGVFGGNSGIFMPEEVDGGCLGTMPACYMPEVFRKTWDMLEAGNTDEAVAYFTPFSRLAAYEKDVCNRCVWKEILVQRGVIADRQVREPRPSFAEDWQFQQLLRVARRAGLLPKQ